MYIYIGPNVPNTNTLKREDMLKVCNDVWHGMLHIYGLRWQMPEFFQALTSIRAIVIGRRTFNAFAEYKPLPSGFTERMVAKSYYDWLHKKITIAKEGDVIMFFSNAEMCDHPV